ncbi:carbon monoxide dehydrogenase subunit G [Actinomycetospora sp. NBRC 106375]|uniref:SRPBCC family protein n=1 Tax=Actinomycetospora sp. NBRC 106375 TaxID=3032207 RepID=UPI0024A55A9B|nr:SRPBCC family protein [Actinomycetospora sp. NBRC 106375]GLZ45615.1 carbon monoxide dehydrogenase subunit G [Actinomycetospora sp. NBRC 106375]
MKLENEFTVPVDIDTVFDALNDPEKVTPCFPGATLDSHDGDDFTGTVKVKLGPISMTYKGKGTFVERDKSNHKVVVDAQGRDSRGNGTASAKATLTMTDGGGGKTKVNVLTEMQVTGKPAQFGRGVMSDVGDKILGQFASCLADEFGGGGAPAAAPASGASSSPSGGNGTAPAGDAVATSGGDAPVSAPAAPTPVSAGSGAPAAAAMPSTVAEAAKADTGAKPGGSVAAAATSAAQGAASAGQSTRQRVEAIDLLDSSRDAVLKRLAPVGIGAGVLAAIIAIILIARGRSS